MDTKFIGFSKTIVGLLIAALALFCQWKGITFTADDQGAIADSMFMAIEAVGIVIALVGRIVASQPLHIVPKKDENSSGPSAGMFLLVGMLSLGILGTGALSGCSTFVTATPATPQDQAIKEVRQATVLYIVAVTTFTNLVATGKIDRDTAMQVETIRQRAWARLSAAKQAAESGAALDADAKLQLFIEDVNAINAIILKIPAAPVPTTLPA